MCWVIARQIGQWPQDVYEDMPVEWLWFGVGLTMRENAEQKKAVDKVKHSRTRRTMTGEQV